MFDGLNIDCSDVDDTVIGQIVDDIVHVDLFWIRLIITILKWDLSFLCSRSCIGMILRNIASG